MSYKAISDYGLIGDMHSCALVSKAGSVDWCCLPRFDGAAVFSRLLDQNKRDYFEINLSGIASVQRRYLPDTNVLETTFQTETGKATLTDFMPLHHHPSPTEPLEVRTGQRISRILECTQGSVGFSMVCYPRFDYGTIVPHAVASGPNHGFAHGGAEALSIYSSAPMTVAGDGFQAEGRLTVGQQFHTAVSNQYSFSHQGDEVDAGLLDEELAQTVAFWREWSGVCTYTGRYRDDVVRSALVLKALTYAPSGGLVAATTTSLPETIGGSRNWDYRFTWLRDAAFALYALSIVGYTQEAHAFKQWLEWSTAGRPQDLQIMYGLGGERRLTEIELPELEGYRRSRPVRIGNAAYSQFQLDIYGEVMDSAHTYRKFGGEIDPEFWEYLTRLAQFVVDHWREPDDGIWETRGGRRHFVYSKVLCWVALDRAVKAAVDLGLPGDVDLWRRVRDEIKAEVLDKGYDTQRGVFVQSYGSRNLDAANLMLPLVGFIDAKDPRMTSTIEAVQRELTSPQGYVYRYRDYDDGLGGTEGTFTICTLWLADNLIALGRLDEARHLYEKCLGCRNDLGLLSEEIDPETEEMLGNFPQAFSHLALINTAVQLQQAEGGS